MIDLDEPDLALLDLHSRLVAHDYRFTTPTPASHARVIARGEGRPAEGLRDILGWSLPFAPDVLPRDLRDMLRAGGMLDETQPHHRSRVRVSSVGAHNYLHSAYPTTAEDAVFLGPDSYRFANLITAELSARAPALGSRIVDIGVGAGVGAITASDFCGDATIFATDLNPQALRLARINAAQAGIAITFVETSGLAGLTGAFDLALINPPFIVDVEARTYRHGGDMHGGRLSLDLAGEALTRLAPGGRLILYTGSAIIDGVDRLREALAIAASGHGCSFRYGEIDPDVFGEELATPAYADVDRIAAVSAIFTREA